MHRHVHVLMCDIKAKRVQLMGSGVGGQQVRTSVGRAQLFCVVSSAEGERIAGSEWAGCRA